MIYSYSQSASEGIYFYIRVGTPALTEFQIVRFSACQTAAVPTLVTPTTVATAFDTATTFNKYDAEHFHLQPVAGSHRFIANSGLTGLRLHLFSINTDSLVVTQVTLRCFFNKIGW